MALQSEETDEEEAQQSLLLADTQQGQRIKAITEIAVGELRIPAHTTGFVVEVSKDKESAVIRFDLSLCHSSEARLGKDDIDNLVLAQKPKGRKRMLFGLIMITTLFVLGIVYHKQCSFQLKRFIAYCKTLGLWSALLILVVCSMLPVIMMPVFPMMALSGPLFTQIYDGNPWIGGSVAFAAVFTGLWNGSVIAFALGKNCFHEYAKQAGKENKYLRRLNKIIDKGGTRIVFMARSLPVLPAEVFDYACAVTSLRTWQYAIGCLGSAVPVAFWCYSTAQAATAATEGTEGVENKAGKHVLLIGLNIVIVALLTVMILYAIKNAEDLEEDGAALPGIIMNANPDIEEIKEGVAKMRASFARASSSSSPALE